MSVKFRLGTTGLALGLAGGIVWAVFHRASPVSAPAARPAKAISVSPTETRPAQPETVSIVDWLFPNPDGSATDGELLALARKAVARSPERAIEWARSQSDSVLRARLLFAVIRAWGENDPAGAVDWVVIQDASERWADMEAALAGAVRQPQLAVAIVRQLLKDDPDDSNGCGTALILALGNAGQFQAALEFLNSGPPDSRADWAAATFRRWGESQPQDALPALDSLADGNLRDTAFRAVADGWSASDPPALATYAVSLPAGENRGYALSHAFDSWSLQDPSAMAAWLNTLPPGGDYDQGAAVMLAKTDAANATTETALQWAESISDPALKIDALLPVLNQWAQTDGAAAAEYVKNAAWLDDQQRSTLLQKIGAVR